MNYFKKEDLSKINFYNLYKELFNNEKYNQLNSNSKWVYIMLLDNLNIANADNVGNLSLIIREQIQKMLNISINTTTKLFKELTDVGLVLELKQGVGEPNLIYPLKSENTVFIDSLNNDEYVPIICESLTQEKIEPVIIKEIIENFTDYDITKAIDEIRKENLEHVKLLLIHKSNINSISFCENDKKMLKIAIQLIIGSTKFIHIDKKIMIKALLECKAHERNVEVPVIKILVESILNMLNKEMVDGIDCNN